MMLNIERAIEKTEEAFDLVHSDFIGTEDFDEKEWEQEKQYVISLLKEHSEGTWIEHRNAPGVKYECSFCHIRSAAGSPFCAWCGSSMIRVVTSFA